MYGAPPPAPPGSGYGSPAPPGSGYGPAAPPPGPASPYGYGTAPGPVDNQGRPLSGWWLRFAAIVIDGLILGIPRAILIDVFVQHAK